MRDVVAHTAGYKDVLRTRACLRALVQQRFGLAACEEAERPDDLEWLTELFDAQYRDTSRTYDKHQTDGSSEAEDSASSGDSEGDNDTLPPGQMDSVTKRVLREATRRTPRYLFRCWNNSDIFPSGGHKDLNTVDAITPLAFKKGKGSSSIYDLRRDTLAEMVAAHLGGLGMETHLSSWAASLRVAMQFARGSPEDCYISVLDTKLLRNRNAVLHVPTLSFLSYGSYGFDEEYLAHGVIEGSAYRTAPLQAFEYPRYWTTDPSTDGISQITADEVSKARQVGEMFGGSFIVPVTVAILCQKGRSTDYWRSGCIPELQTVATGLSGCEIPKELCADATILTDIVYTLHYPDVEQMIRLLRALVSYHHGRGARRHNRVRARSPSAPDLHGRAGGACVQ